jgi:hypothetical protein
MKKTENTNELDIILNIVRKGFVQCMDGMTSLINT